MYELHLFNGLNIYTGGIIILRPGVFVPGLFVQKPLACVIIPSNPIYMHVLRESKLVVVPLLSTGNFFHAKNHIVIIALVAFKAL